MPVNNLPFLNADLQAGVSELVVPTAGQAPKPQVRAVLFNEPAKNLAERVVAPRLAALVDPFSAKARQPGGQSGSPDINSTIDRIEY